MTGTEVHIPTLTTERLTLRAPRPSDISTYASFYAQSDMQVGKYRGGISQTKVAEILDEDIRHWAKGFGIWVLTLTGNSKVIGGAGIVHPDNWPSHELTWWLMPSSRGSGYATEASQAVINWAYNCLGWGSVETHFRDENAPVRNLTKRLGGKFDRRELFPDGVSRDVFVLPRSVAS